METVSERQKGLRWLLPVGVGVIGGIAYGMDASGSSGGGFLIITSGALLYLIYASLGKNLADIRALLSLFWLGGVGLASFRLSCMHTPWNRMTWLCFFGFYLTFIYLYEIIDSLLRRRVANKKEKLIPSEETLFKRLYALIWITALLPFVCFWVEVAIMRYIPLFSRETHAYGEFHITGIHYFTFSSMLTHGVSMLYIMEKGFRQLSETEKKRLLLANVLALSIPIFCLSKLQFFMIFFLPVLLILQRLHFEHLRELPWKKILITGAACLSVLFAVGIIFTVRRNYEAGYLNEIFEMRDPDMPMLFQYLYMYIAHNFANFNYLVENVTEFAGGLREAFPVFALTGLKFVFPQVLRYGEYLIKPELSTLTIIYDAYYDFGLFGVLILGGITGGVAAGLSWWVRAAKNPIASLFYCEFATYMVLSFFSAWFTNPTVWFWFAVTLFMYLYIDWDRIKGHLFRSGKNDRPSRK